jgi:hypothetical protein
MTTRLILVAVLSALSACAATPERQAITQACSDGNLDACVAAETLRVEQRRPNPAAMLIGYDLMMGQGY